MTVDPNVVWMVLALFGIGGGLIGVIQTLKRILKLNGIGAIVLTAVCSFVATGIVLATSGTFTVVSLLIYGAIVFGEASGLYHVFTKPSTA